MLKKMPRCCASLCLLLCLAPFTVAQGNRDQDGGDELVIAQISDTHLGLKRAPDATDNLRRVVQMVNGRHPDAVIMTGDIGENDEAWNEAREILSGLSAKIYYIPGNHDVNAHDLDRWRKYWGKDYDEIHIKWVTIFGLNSQLLGNYDDFHAHGPVPLSSQGQT